SLAGIVECQMIRIAGDEMDEAVIQHLKDKYNLMIGERTAEDVKIKLGSAYKLDEETSMEVKGRDLVSGLPKTLTVSSEEIREALKPPVEQIVKVVKDTLERTPPELAADLVDRGIMLAGGGSRLKGLDRILSEETGLPVSMAEDPLISVAVGAGKCLDEISFLRRIAAATQD
ncbi:MAG TPA: rod shape-determining protein, partial [Candidatus Omnitrophica bacterium]|nr:rod shape-determining protein [Candidatus Omnitrophota bacterium]